jgi:beta-lactamase class C
MKILKKSVTRRKNFKFLSLLNIRLVVLSLCVLLPALKVQAQEKQISYPVAVPIERTAATSVSSSAAVKAPTPIIRSVDEAATPPVRAKAPVKKSTSAQPAAKSSKTPAVKKTTTKSTSVTAKKKAPATQKAKKPTAKSTPKKSTQNSKATLAKTPAPKKLSGTKPVASATKVPAQVKNTNERLAPEPSSNKVVNTPATNLAPTQLQITPDKNSTGPLAVPIIAGAALASAAVSAEEEQELARSLADEGEYSAELDVPETPMPKTATPAVVVAAPASLAAKTSLPMSNQREAFVTEFKNFVETKIVPKTPGLALAIIADGKVKVLETYGFKKAGSNALINADTVFRLASVSKSFAATAAAIMVNDGLIRWDTKVTDVLPNVEFSNPRYGDQLTVQHILSQATGLPTQANSNFIEEGLSFDEVVRRLRYVNFVCPPGKCYNYQNVTYSLIGNIVLKKTGVTYEQYLENKVLRPLGMRTATVGYVDYTANNNYAVPHLPTRKGWVPTTVTEHYYRVNPAAGVNASITDMSRWLLAHMGQNPAVLSPSILNAVHAKITRNTPAQNHYGSREGVTNSHYGLGWRVFDYRGDKNFVHHGGGVKGFRSEMVFNPELKIGMVILTNGPRLAGSVIFDFLDAYEDEKRGEKKREAAAPVKKKKK